MANPFRRIVQPLSCSLTTYSIKCFGANQRGRNCAKVFGFSASIAAFGYGVKTFGEDLKHVRPTKIYQIHIPKLSRIDTGGRTSRTFKPFEGSRYFPIPLVIQKWLWDDSVVSDCFSKIFGFLRLFITPVSCEEGEEDSICDCIAKCKEKSASNNVDKTNEKASESKASPESSNSNAPAPPTPPPRPPVSNKPCKTGATRSTSSCGKAPSDIDLDEISRQLGGISQVEWIPETDLSHCNLIRQACQVSVDSVTRIITETASAYEDYHAEYRSILDTLIDTLEDSRTACGVDLEVIECKIVLIKAKADEMKRRIRDLDMFIGSLEKLGQASAEAAFMAHAEYASIAMSERINSLITEVTRLRDESREKERDMLQLQSLIIIESGRSLK